MSAAMPAPHSTKQELEGYISGLLSTDDNLVHTHLEQCEVAMETQWDGPERRSEPRVRVNVVGHLKLLDPVTSVGPPHDVQVIEISHGGLKIHTPRFIILQIRFNDQVTLAECRYCIRIASGGYHSGLRQLKDFPSV